ncbi:hypothetical protein, partial [Stenotrophomonas sp.]|uniref:hypothetical protein n=1 Tax=Stenotrophomonas sp. TaxID=69392 RepID=UPI0028AE4326
MDKGLTGHVPMSKTQAPNRSEKVNFKGLWQGVPPYGMDARALQPAHLVLTRKGLIDWILPAQTTEQASDDDKVAAGPIQDHQED